MRIWTFIQYLLFTVNTHATVYTHKSGQVKASYLFAIFSFIHILFAIYFTGGRKK